jgi:hypothetical protein
MECLAHIFSADANASAAVGLLLASGFVMACVRLARSETRATGARFSLPMATRKESTKENASPYMSNAAKFFVLT